MGSALPPDVRRSFAEHALILNGLKPGANGSLLGLQLRRAISIHVEGKKLLEKHAIAPSASDGLLDAALFHSLFVTRSLLLVLCFYLPLPNALPLFI